MRSISKLQKKYIVLNVVMSPTKRATYQALTEKRSNNVVNLRKKGTLLIVSLF